MTLRSSLLRELEKPNLSVERRVYLSCELAKDHEYRGEYEETRKALRGLWTGITLTPIAENRQFRIKSQTNPSSHFRFRGATCGRNGVDLFGERRGGHWVNVLQPSAVAGGNLAECVRLYRRRRGR